MQMLTPISIATDSQEEEYVTIVAPTIAEVMQRFRDSDLAQRGFLIEGRVARHRFAYAGEATKEDLFNGELMTAATFVRRTH